MSSLTWTPPGGANPYVTATDSKLYLDSGYINSVPGHPGSGDVQVTATAPASGFWSFSFSLSLSPGSGSAAGYYQINGSRFSLTGGNGTLTNIALNAGDVFGFGVGGSQYNSSLPGGEASLAITSFSAPVPEPSTVLLTFLGLVSVGLLRQRRETFRPRFCDRSTIVSAV